MSVVPCKTVLNHLQIDFHAVTENHSNYSAVTVNCFKAYRNFSAENQSGCFDLMPNACFFSGASILSSLMRKVP